MCRKLGITSKSIFLYKKSGLYFNCPPTCKLNHLLRFKEVKGIIFDGCTSFIVRKCRHLTDIYIFVFEEKFPTCAEV